MRKNFRTAFFVGLWLLIAAALTAYASDRSAVGTWKLDTSKSSYGTLPRPTFEQLVITTDSSGALAWKLTGAMHDGKTFNVSFDGPIDGKYHPIAGNEAGHEIAYTRIPGGGMNWSVRTRNGFVFETGSSHLSADGNTLTRTGTVQTPEGKSEFVSVYTRVQ